MPRRSILAGQAMHYPLRVRQQDVVISSLSNAAQETAIAIEASAADVFIFDVDEPFIIAGFRTKVTVAIDYDTQTAAAVISLDRRVTYASDTGRVELGTITIPDATAAGIQVYSTDFTPTQLDRGDQLVVEVKTAGTGGMSIAGDWLPVLLRQSADFEDITLPALDTAALVASV